MASEAQVSLPPLTARRWSVAQWHEQACEWQALLTRSQADPLFLSFEWLSSWWSCFGDSLGQSPEVLAFYRGTQLAGLAPLYRQRVLRNGFLPAQSMQMMGLAWRDPEPLISEYLDVIGAEADLAPLREACVRQLLEDPAWSEFVIGFTASGSEWRAAYQRCAGGERYYVRELDRSVAYQADLSCGFAPYLAGLEQSTRRSLWNLRHRLGGAGQVLLENVAQEGIGRAFQDLNRLHQLRCALAARGGDAREACRPQERHVDRRRGYCKTLIGAYVGRGLAAADVLLARLKREREPGAAFGILRAPHDAARHLPHEREAGRHEAEVRSAASERHTQGLALAADDVGAAPSDAAPLARRLVERERGGIHHRDHQNVVRMRPIGELIDLLQVAEEIRLLQHQRGGIRRTVRFERLERRQAAAAVVIHRLEFQALIARDRTRHASVRRVHGARQQDAPRSRRSVRAHGHEARLGQA